MSIGKLKHVTVTGDQLLALTWDDGQTATVDLADIIAGRKILKDLADPIVFGQASLSEDGWSIEWPTGVDFGSPQLRRWADEQAGEAMPATAFRAWMDGHGFTFDRAAAALGLSRRMIAYYLSGEQVIPKTVMLATLGFDQRDAA